MGLVGRHVISINDLTNAEIEALLSLADEMLEKLQKGQTLSLAQDKMLATLFYEPSSRTRLSFEAAMLRLGGKVLSCADAPRQSSVAKGESIADTIRILSLYADLIVMRHPRDGAARLAADYASVPLINGGDGAHEHPTQTLCDLYTIRRELGQIHGVTVALCGDLRHARTIHSLALGLARLGAKLACIAPLGLSLPKEVRHRLQGYKALLGEYSLLEQSLAKVGTGQRGFPGMLLETVDVFYFTRLQQERYHSALELSAAQESFHINQQLIENAHPNALLLHPLPRREELSYTLDSERRAAYFRQAGYGVPVRMALIALLLGLVPVPASLKRVQDTRERAAPPPFEAPQWGCGNEACVIVEESYAARKLRAIPGKNRAYECYYCERELGIAPSTACNDSVPLMVPR